MSPPTDSPPIDLARLSKAELKRLVVKQWEDLAELNRVVAALRDEIARLKGGPPRPNIKPSGMEQATDPKPLPGNERRKRGDTRSKLSIDEERIVEVAAPPGARFKGTTSFVVQDLVIRRHVVDFRRQRWLTAEGRVPTAPRLVTLLHTLGILISKREVVRLLDEGHDGFHAEARDVLRAGLASSSWITVDDTGARHQAKNGFCTQIGNDHFSWFGTTASKSRLNFLSLLRAGHGDYVINAAALAYMRERALPAYVTGQLAEHRDRCFADQAAWNAHLEKLGITAPNPVLIATEGALWGSVQAHGFLRDAVIISDDAGQFNVGQHGLCWVHTERLVHKLDTFTDQNRAAQSTVRAEIWQLYRDLKAYKCAPSQQHKAPLAAAFDHIFTGKTGFVTLDRLLARLNANKPELLKVLDRPEIPLHTNGTENDIRCHVTRRKVSGGTRSDLGRDCRDAFLTLLKTCAKLCISFWDYLGARLQIPGSAIIPPLPELVLARARPP